MNGRGCVRENTLGNERTEVASHEIVRGTSLRTVLLTSEMGIGISGGNCSTEKFKRTKARIKLRREIKTRCLARGKILGHWREAAPGLNYFLPLLANSFRYGHAHPVGPPLVLRIFGKEETIFGDELMRNPFWILGGERSLRFTPYPAFLTFLPFTRF